MSSWQCLAPTLTSNCGGAHSIPSPHPESLLVFYLGSTEAVEETCERVGAQQVAAANPWWRTHGITLVDPDGFHVVLVGRWNAT